MISADFLPIPSNFEKKNCAHRWQATSRVVYGTKNVVPVPGRTETVSEKNTIETACCGVRLRVILDTCDVL